MPNGCGVNWGVTGVAEVAGLFRVPPSNDQVREAPQSHISSYVSNWRVCTACATVFRPVAETYFTQKSKVCKAMDEALRGVTGVMLRLELQKSTINEKSTVLKGISIFSSETNNLSLVNNRSKTLFIFGGLTFNWNSQMSTLNWNYLLHL